MTLPDEEVLSLVQHLTDAQALLESLTSVAGFTPDVFNEDRKAFVATMRAKLKMGGYPYDVSLLRPESHDPDSASTTPEKSAPPR